MTDTPQLQQDQFAPCEDERLFPERRAAVGDSHDAHGQQPEENDEFRYAGSQGQTPVQFTV